MNVIIERNGAKIEEDQFGGFRAVVPDPWNGKVVGLAFKQKDGSFNIHDIARGGHPVNYRSRGGAIRALLRLASQET